MGRFLLVCLGGAIGSGARYLFSTAMSRVFGNFPIGTLGVNVIGSFVISLVMVLALDRGAIGVDARLFIVTGVLGGFTTYSSFNYETTRLAAHGAVNAASMNVLVTLLGGVAAGLLGMLAAQALLARS